MTLYYLDASAWVKRYRREMGSTWLAGFLTRGHPVASSALGVVEVTATLARQRKAGQLSADAFRQACDEIDDDWAEMIRVAMTDAVVDRSRAVARSLATQGADSIHLATAQLLADGLTVHGSKLVMVSSDDDLLAASEASGTPILNPVEEEAKGNP